MEVQRQCSRGSTRSSSVSALQMRVQEYILQNDREEWKHQVEYAERRRNKQLMKKEKKRLSRMRRTRLLYVPAFLGMGLGSVILFSAGVRAIGGHTFFWTYRQIFFIVGSVILIIGVVFLLVAAGVQNHQMEKEKKRRLNAPVICTKKHPDFIKEDLSRQSSWNSSRGSNYNPLLLTSASEKRGLLHPHKYNRNLSPESSFSSTVSASTSNQNYVSKWAQSTSSVSVSPKAIPLLAKTDPNPETETNRIAGCVFSQCSERPVPRVYCESAPSSSTPGSVGPKDGVDLQEISEENSFEVEV